MTGKPTEDGIDIEQIGLLLGRAYYNYLNLLTRLLDETGLSEHCKPGMGSLLFTLWRRDDQTPKEIAESLNVAKSTITRQIDALKKSGLVRTCPDPNDGRGIRVSLTTRAKKLQPDATALAVRVEDLLVQGMTPRQSATLRSLLTTVTGNITEELKNLS